VIFKVVVVDEEVTFVVVGVGTFRGVVVREVVFGMEDEVPFEEEEVAEVMVGVVVDEDQMVVVPVGIKDEDLGEVVPLMDQIGLGDVVVVVAIPVELQWIIDHRKWHGLTINNSSSLRRAITTKLTKSSIMEVVTTCISMIRPGRVVVVKVVNILILISDTALLIGVVDTSRGRVEAEVEEGVEEQEVVPSGLMLQQEVGVQRGEKATPNNNHHNNKLKIIIMKQRLLPLRLVHLHSWAHSSGNNRWDIREGDLPSEGAVVYLAEGVGGQEDLAVPQCRR